MQVTSIHALTIAWERVQSNNGAPGGDGVSVADFAQESAVLLVELHQELSAGTYHPLPMRHVRIPKDRGGYRRLSIPAVRDRIVQTAVATGLSAAWEPEFSPASFAYRPGRSVDQAVRQVSLGYRDGFTHLDEQRR